MKSLVQELRESMIKILQEAGNRDTDDYQAERVTEILLNSRCFEDIIFYLMEKQRQEDDE